MTIWEMLALAVSLAMDALAVSASAGLTLKKAGVGTAVRFGTYFGGFQLIMPLIGFFFGSLLGGFIAAVDHWIAFLLLAIIGGKMFFDAVTGGEEETELKSTLPASQMLLLAVATSIDALAVGVSLAFAGISRADILIASLVIGAVAFGLSFMGVMAGGKIGSGIQRGSACAGGIVLILIGVKILITHLAGG